MESNGGAGCGATEELNPLDQLQQIVPSIPNNSSNQTQSLLIAKEAKWRFWFWSSRPFDL
jgi:hypothetical protein